MLRYHSSHTQTHTHTHTRTSATSTLAVVWVAISHTHIHTQSDTHTYTHTQVRTSATNTLEVVCVAMILTPGVEELQKPDRVRKKYEYILRFWKLQKHAYFLRLTAGNRISRMIRKHNTAVIHWVNSRSVFRKWNRKNNVPLEVNRSAEAALEGFG
jgi:hypothetical protein